MTTSAYSTDVKRAMLGLRARQEAIVRLRSALFPQQLAFIDDPTRQKCALTARRAGKSFCMAAYLILEALSYPEARCCYFALSRQKAKEQVFDRYLLDLNQQLELGGVPHLGDLSLTFGNGSFIRCAGMDADRHQVEKLRGDAYRLLVIDEAASQRKSDLQNTVEWIIGPALQDQDGTVCLIGTPGSLPHGFFFEATTGRLEGWSGHTWQTVDNPKQRPKYLADVALKKARNPGVIDLPSFRREYLGQWVIDESLLLYPSFSAATCTIDKLPALIPGDKWEWIVGCDVGWHSALVESCWSRGQGRYFITRHWKREGVDLTDIARQVRQWEADRPADQGKQFDRYIIDGAGKQSALEMIRRHNIPWETTDKHSDLKETMIGLLDEDFSSGNVLIIQPPAAHGQPQENSLISELIVLGWDERILREQHKRQEPRPCNNHLADAMLYGWRDAWHREGKKENVKAPPGQSVTLPQRWAQEQFGTQRRRGGLQSGFRPQKNPFPGFGSPR